MIFRPSIISSVRTTCLLSSTRRPQRSAARSRSSGILIYHVVTRATATCTAERPKSFATPRKRSGTLSGTSLSGARSTNTLDMLPPGHHAGPTHPWTRLDAQTRPPGSTYAAQGLVHAPRPTERAAVATTTRLPLRPSSPALFPRATGRVRSGLAALAGSGYSSSRATAGGGVEFRPFNITIFYMSPRGP